MVVIQACWDHAQLGEQLGEQLDEKLDRLFAHQRFLFRCFILHLATFSVASALRRPDSDSTKAQLNQRELEEMHQEHPQLLMPAFNP